MSGTGIPEMREAYRQVGPRRFWTIFIVMAASIGGWAALGVWLQSEIGWPERYGFSCNGRGCLFVDIWHSLVLLQAPGGYQLGLFAWIWSMPAFFVACIVYALVKRRRARTYL